MVSLGTWIESATDSHQHASRWVYHHPVFKALLIGFFVNILVATLRRYPFKRKHIPFIITHIGLLMIISGSFIKINWGLQGQLFLTEGSGGHSVFLQEEYVITLEDHGELIKEHEIKRDLKGNFYSKTLKIRGQSSHSKTLFEALGNSKTAQIFGLPLLEMGKVLKAPFPFEKNIQNWHYYFERTDTLVSTIQNLFRKHHKGKLHLLLNEDFTIQSQWVEQTGTGEPFLLIAKVPAFGTILVLCSSVGEVYFAPYPHDSVPEIVSFDKGHQGFATLTKIPEHILYPKNDDERFFSSFSSGLPSDHTLFPPLYALKRTCEKQGRDFLKTWYSLLSVWKQSGSWLYPKTLALDSSLKTVLTDFPWSSLSKEERKGVLWTSIIFESVVPHRSFLEQGQWPFKDEYNAFWDENGDLIPHKKKEFEQLLTEHTFVIAQNFPENDLNIQTAEESFHYLSALFRLQRLHLDEIAQVESSKSIELLSPLTTRTVPLSPLDKWEDNLPALLLEIEDGIESESILLVLDRLASGIPYPIFNGKYLLRFQLKKQNIPYHIRLHDSKQINYLNTNKAYSYESIVSIAGPKLPVQKQTLSMNHVFETPKGYRFYMSSIFPQSEESVQRVQITVNKDPAKYILTYPGAVILVLGILFLLWFQPYQRKR